MLYEVITKPEVFLVIGGHHATVVPEDFNESAFDLVVIGEGVVALREILRRNNFV